ncbi:MAG: hypothetical protein R3F43_23060 [bacterium]
MLRLVSPGGARRRVATWSLVSGQGSQDRMNTVEKAFGRAGLLVTDQTGQAGYTELAHDTLLTRWSRISAWVEDDRRYHTLHHALAQEVEQWESEQSPGQLWDRDARLAQARELRKEGRLNRLETRFLKKSIQRHERRRMVALALTLGIIATLAGVAVYALVQRHDALRSAGAAEAARDRAVTSARKAKAAEVDAVVAAVHAASEAISAWAASVRATWNAGVATLSAIAAQVAEAEKERQRQAAVTAQELAVKNATLAWIYAVWAYLKKIEAEAQARKARARAYDALAGQSATDAERLLRQAHREDERALLLAVMGWRLAVCAERLNDRRPAARGRVDAALRQVLADAVVGDTVLLTEARPAGVATDAQGERGGGHAGHRPAAPARRPC